VGGERERAREREEEEEGRDIVIEARGEKERQKLSEGEIF
jgi:hypothetical protein